MPGRPVRRSRRFGFVRTTAFKLSAIFIAIFTLFATFLIGYIGYNTGRILTQQVAFAVNEELNLLARQYRQGGLRRLVGAIERRSDRPGASLYLLSSGDGTFMAGNVASVPPDVLAVPDPQLRSIRYQRFDDEGTTEEHSALVRVFELPRNFTLLVGRDISERDHFIAILRQSLFLTFALMIVLGLISWIFVSRRVLKRIDSVAETSGQIMQGDLTGRLEVTGTGDEFDRLAYSLNGMLDRIERLMAGLKEVSDNIAHDLKTPLTRMRSRVENTLTSARTEPDYREALQATIDDCDQLIKTFDALLMIARVEAGSSTAIFEPVDLAAVAHDVAELYEPVAEEEGVTLTFDMVGKDLAVSGNRELLSQAVANLLDNAIKYSTGSDEQPAVSVAVLRDRTDLLVKVADNGPGIPASDRDHVTERFVRLEESRSRPGAGLGLSMVSAVAKLHNGQLLLSDNRPGLCAELRLPVYKGPHDRPSAS